MKLISSSINQVTNTGSANRHVQHLQINTSGAGNSLILTKFVFKKNKKSLSPTEVYYTGKDSVFSTDWLVGKLPATRQNEMRGTVNLNEGINHFWVVSNGAETQLLSFDLATQGYSLVWTDEFNSDTINRANWSFEKGFVRNAEHQWYQEENASCRNGVLTIEAKREKKANPAYVSGSTDWRKNRPFIEYTSSSMRTAGKQQWLYGRFEMKARIDTVSGYWPAWWTLGVNKRWPANGEMDIMEYYTGKVLANIAVASANPGKAMWYSHTKAVQKFPSNWKDSFHVWRMDWDEQRVAIYIDDVLLNEQPQSVLYNRHDTTFYPFKQPHYMLLNLAIGGENGGSPDGTNFPLKYEVDYVRVSQKREGLFTRVGTFQPIKQKPLKTPL